MKKVFAIILSLCLVGCLVIGGVYASKNMSFFQWGEKNAEINQVQSEDVVAKVNGVQISKDKFDSYKAGLANASGEFTDKEIIDKLVEQEIIMQEIKRLGYTVTDAEVVKFNNERFALLDEDPAAYQIIKDYVDGLGVTMEEYKEMSLEISKTALLANKYKADIQKEFIEKNPQLKSKTSAQKQQKFEQYFADKIETLYEKADVEIFE